MYRDAASHRQHLLDEAQAQRKAEIQPDRIADADELSGVAIAGMDRVFEASSFGADT
jgi:hypothetical protein